METFQLHHLALYAKGWYKRFDVEGRGENKNIWDDLKITMTLDGYSGEYMSRNDILGVMLTNCQRLKHRNFSDMSVFVSGIAEGNCWKYGYYVKSHDWVKGYHKLPQYDYWEAVARYCISSLAFLTVKELQIDELPVPDYTKKLPRKQGITDKKLKEFFGHSLKN